MSAFGGKADIIGCSDLRLLLTQSGQLPDRVYTPYPRRRIPCNQSPTARANLEAAMEGVDALLCPSAPGAAPGDLGATGDPVFNRMGTALRAPCVNIPGLSGRSGLPVGVQVMGRMKDDRRTLAVGDWLHRILRRG